MDEIIGKLSTDLLWVAVGLVVLQILLTNADKLWPVISGRGSVERSTRHLPELLERLAKLEAAGHDRMANLIRVHIDGVMFPRTRRIHSKQIRREVNRYQSWWSRVSVWVTAIVYALVSLAFYWTVTLVGVGFIERSGNPVATMRDYITLLITVVVYVVGGVLISRLYKWHLNHVGTKSDRAYQTARSKWLEANRLVEVNQSPHPSEGNE